MKDDKTKIVRVSKEMHQLLSSEKEKSGVPIARLIENAVNEKYEKEK